MSILASVNLRELDTITIKEIEHFAELKYNEHMQLRGQIARDLGRIGENAYRDITAYRKLEKKYKAGKRAGLNKKLAILQMNMKEWCK